MRWLRATLRICEDWSVAVVPDLYGCELVESRLDKDGYAYYGKSRAHIVAWVEANGPLPLSASGEPLQIDHMCRRRNCIALHHLEPVTRSENQKRIQWAYRCRIKVCPRGHLMAHAVVVPDTMGRVCRTCNAEAISSSERYRTRHVLRDEE